MSQPNRSTSQTDTQNVQGGNQALSATKIMETCIFVTDLELSEGQRYVAKRKFIMSIVNSAGATSSIQQSTPENASPIPEPPPGTKSIWQRKRDLKAETLINNAKPLTAIAALQNQIVVLGIEKDVLTVRVGELEAANTLLSIENGGFRDQVLKWRRRASRHADSIAKLEEATKKMQSDLHKATERLRNNRHLMARQRESARKVDKRLNKDLPTFLLKLHRLESLRRANKSLVTRLHESKKIQDEMSITAHKENDEFSSAKGQLLIYQKRLESERQAAVLARKQHIEDRMKITETIRGVRAINDSLTAEVDKLRKDQLSLQQTILQSSDTLSGPVNHNQTQTAANRARINLSATTTFVECRKLLEAQHAENTRLTTSNNSLRKGLDEANRARTACESGVSYSKDLLLELKDELKTATELVVKLGADKAVLQSDLDTQAQEHAAATEKLKKQLRRSRGTIEKSTKENQEYKNAILKLQRRDGPDCGLESPSTVDTCIMVTFLVAVMILLVIGLRCLLFCSKAGSAGR